MATSMNSVIIRIILASSFSLLLPSDFFSSLIIFSKKKQNDEKLNFLDEYKWLSGFRVKVYLPCAVFPSDSNNERKKEKEKKSSDTNKFQSDFYVTLIPFWLSTLERLFFHFFCRVCHSLLFLDRGSIPSCV